VERQILPELIKQWPNVIFEFVGAGAPQRTFDPRMRFLGFIDDYPAHLKAADVVISPMLRGEGFPTKIIEALACGKPTVTTMIGARGIPRSFQNLHVCRVEQFAQVIGRLLAEKRGLKPNDAEIRSRYSWDALLQPLPSALEEIWNRKTSDSLSIRHARLS
jgi:glycosyltransferase involved in cell wall biosynthesis